MKQRMFLEDDYVPTTVARLIQPENCTTFTLILCNEDGEVMFEMANISEVERFAEWLITEARQIQQEPKDD